MLPVGAAFLLALLGLRSVSSVREVEAFRTLAAAAGARSDLDADFILAVVTKESGGNPRARSSVGALGLMQLRPAAAADAAKRLGEPAPTEIDLLDPAINLKMGASYLRILIDRYKGARDVALAAYLKGPEWVARQGGIDGVRAFLQKPSEVATYVSRILDLAERFRVRSGG